MIVYVNEVGVSEWLVVVDGVKLENFMVIFCKITQRLRVFGNGRFIPLSTFGFDRFERYSNGLLLFLEFFAHAEQFAL